MRRNLTRFRDERGAALVWVAASMVALCGMVALSVDYGMLTAARTGAQRAADAAALAGASAFIDGPLNDLTALEALAIQRAQQYAALNRVRGATPQVLPEDVDVLFDEEIVRVRVLFHADRGNAFGTWFARVLGIDRVDIGAVAAAEAFPASSHGGHGGGRCLLPLALLDEWEEGGDPEDGVWSGEPPDFYDRELTGYDASDHGTLVTLKLSGGSGGGGGPAWCEEPSLDVCSTFETSWSCWFRPDHPSTGGGGGTDVLGPQILGESCPELSVGDLVWEASGAGEKQSLVTEEFRQLVESDPNVSWDPNLGCVVRAGEQGCVEHSTRLRSVPLVNPETVGPGSGANNEGVVVDFAGAFVERVSCAYDAGDFGGPEGHWNVYIRLLPTLGHDPGDDVGDEETLNKNLRLVE